MEEIKIDINKPIEEIYNDLLEDINGIMKYLIEGTEVYNRNMGLAANAPQYINERAKYEAFKDIYDKFTNAYTKTIYIKSYSQYVKELMEEDVDLDNSYYQEETDNNGENNVS